MELSASMTNPPLGAILVAEVAREGKYLLKWTSETKLIANDDIVVTRSGVICRFLARQYAPQLYGSTFIERTEVDQWLTLSNDLSNMPQQLPMFIKQLEDILSSQKFLVGKNLTMADLVCWAAVFLNPNWHNMIADKTLPSSVQKWYMSICNNKAVRKVIENLPAEIKPIVSTAAPVSKQNKDLGKFVELPGAEMGKIVVRFPPEASGYLHIGHAKAALLNQHYKEKFNGKLIMRFDDTNPAKEKADFEKVILEDLKMLEVKWDKFSHTSDHFDLCLSFCEKLIKEGKAFADDTLPELMKEEREKKIESKRRNTPPAENLKIWEEMKKGTELGQKYCIRLKIDMSSVNGCMRDPVIYRCKDEPHVKTGYKYKAYPTYDFACPIVDSEEEVTHALRTTEYHDRDAQYYWLCDALGIRKPYIHDYARLCMNNTVLSKRKLTWFVNEGYVDGWDDPRMPTVRGVLRRGMTVEGLRQFIIAQGSSRSVVNMGWDKIWAINKQVVEPTAPRYTAIEKEERVPVFISGAKEEALTVQKHPKDEKIGYKTVWTAPKVFIEAADAEMLKEGENTTFVNYGNVMIKKIHRQHGKVESIEGDANLDNKDYKKTLKITWLADTPKAPLVPTVEVDFDHLINKPVLDKEEDFKQFIGHQTWFEKQLLGDPELKNLKKGDIVQILRKGFYICDVPLHISSLTSVEHPVLLFKIPDGKPAHVAAKTQTQDQVKSEKPSSRTAAPSGTTGIADVSKLSEKIVAQGENVRSLKASKADKVLIDQQVKILLALKSDFKVATGSEWKPGAAPVVPAAKSADQINREIAAQGDKVRDLKSKKAEKAVIDSEVKSLLALKAEFKALTGSDWKPSTAPVVTAAKSADQINREIAAQGDKVRDLKSKKADKTVIDSEVKSLLALKAEFKALTGSDWKPSTAPVVTAAKSADQINREIAAQGDKVRDLKSKKADKAVIDSEVKVLLALKAEFKALTGSDWKPTTAPVVTAAKSADQINREIAAQGDKVRDLKSKKADKATIDSEVKSLLALKAEFKAVTGSDWRPIAVPESKESMCQTSVKDNFNATDEKELLKKPQEEESMGKIDVPIGAGPTRAPKSSKKEDTKRESKKMEKKVEKKAANCQESQVAGLKKMTRLGMEAKKEENLPEWYTQVITKSEMIEYYDVSGCYILRPWAFSIWDTIKNFLDEEIKKLGVENCYFPIFVSRLALEKEKEHIQDFAPEVAWVTKSGDKALEEPIAIRPTSETVMYPAYAKWIQSYRDLPLRMNQWNNVVRWEFKHPQPFLRTREFLWQEGHTAFETREEAESEVFAILDLYATIYTDLLAVPVIKGRKSEKEKFAGADFTTTVEAFVPASGRGIQGATSHMLGQNFSKMFDIGFENPETKERSHVWQNSWGITTRTIGVLVMVHADNKGLVLPPRVASVQVVIIPCGITVDTKQEDRNRHYELCMQLEKELAGNGIRVKGDYRDNYSPGWKYSHWELKGVPLRIELGPRDIKKDEFVAVRRDTGDKTSFSRANAAERVKNLLDTIQHSMLEKATQEMKSHIKECFSLSDLAEELDRKNMILAPFCGDKECEEKIKTDSARGTDAEPGAPAMGAKSLCSPFDQPRAITEDMKCIHPDCSKKPEKFTLFGRSY